MDSNMDKVVTGKVVSIHYTLRDAAGEVMDSSDDSEPLHYLHGAENIVPGLENALSGKVVGDQVAVRVEPAEGYGERVGPGPQGVSRSEFPDDLEIVPGMQFFTEGPEGPVPVWVSDVQDDKIFVDNNHPLAGEVLHFDVRVIGIRDATESELEHGHPHGGDGTDMHGEMDDEFDEEYDDEEYEDEDEEGGDEDDSKAR